MSHRRFSSTARRGKSNHRNHRNSFFQMTVISMTALFMFSYMVVLSVLRSSSARLLPEGRKNVKTKIIKKVSCLSQTSQTSQISQESILSDDSHRDDCFIHADMNKGLLYWKHSENSFSRCFK